MANRPAQGSPSGASVSRTAILAETLVLCDQASPRLDRAGLRSFLISIVLTALIVIGMPLAHASPIDPTWIGGISDGADYDELVVLLTEASAAKEVDSLGPLPTVAREYPYRDSIALATSTLISCWLRAPPNRVESWPFLPSLSVFSVMVPLDSTGFADQGAIRVPAQSVREKICAPNCSPGESLCLRRHAIFTY